MIDDVGAIVDRVAQDGAELARKSGGDHALALDQAGIAITRLLAGAAAIDQYNVATTLLQMQSDTDPYHSRSENDHISAHHYPAGSDCSGPLQLLNLGR